LRKEPDQPGWEGPKYGDPEAFKRGQASADQDYTRAKNLHHRIYGKDLGFSEEDWDKARAAARRGREIAADDRPGGAAAWGWNLPSFLAGRGGEQEGIKDVDPRFKEYLLGGVADGMRERAKRGGPFGAAQTIGRGVQESVIDTARSIPNVMRALGMMSPESAERLKTVNEIAGLKYQMDPGSYSGEGIVARALDASVKELTGVARVSGQFLQMAAGAGLAQKAGQVIGAAGGTAVGLSPEAAGATGALTGRAAGTVGGPGQMFALTFPQSYDFAKDEIGLTETQSRFFGLASASIQAAIEKAQIEGLLSKSLSQAAGATLRQRLKKSMANIARQVATQTTEEGLQAAVDPMGKEIIDVLRGDGFEITKPLEAMVDEMGASVLSMAVLATPAGLGGLAGGKRLHQNREKAKEWMSKSENASKIAELITSGKLGTSRKQWAQLPQELQKLAGEGRYLSEGNRREALDTIQEAYKEAVGFKAVMDHVRAAAKAKQPPVEETIPEPPQPTGPPQLPGAEAGVQMEGKEYGQRLDKDTKRIAEHLKKFVRGKETAEERRARMDMARALAEQLLTEEVGSIRAVQGGTPGKGALEQRLKPKEDITETTVDEARKITGGKSIMNEKNLYGPDGIMDKATKNAKKRIGLRKITALTRKAMSKLKSKIKGDKYGDPFKAGSQFEQELNKPGIRRLAERAADDVVRFLDKEGGDRFGNYYEQQNVEEDAIISERFPEFAGDTPYAAALNQFRRGVINAVASAQTELSKNTEETIGVWEAIRSTGKLPMLFEGEAKGEGRPIFALPRPADSKAEGLYPEQLEQIIEVAQELLDATPDDVKAILRGDAPVPDGLTKLSPGKKGQPVKTLNHYIYDWYGYKYVTGSMVRRAFTSSKGLVGKMAVELMKDGADVFRARIRTPFEVGGGTSMSNKAENYRIIDKILAMFTMDVGGRQQPDIQKIVEWLNERVPVEELQARREELGFNKHSAATIRDIIDTVWVAEGQEDTVPRTFIFGPKVGAYMLNRMSDADPRNADYNTMDVWESRFWRSLVDDVLSKEAGISSGAERKVFMRLAREFAQVMQERGRDIRVSAGQAARWYLEKQKAADAGYASAGEIETIPAHTLAKMKDWEHIQLGAQETGNIGDQIVHAIVGEDRALLDVEAEDQQKETLPKKQADRMEKAAKPKAKPKTKPKAKEAVERSTEEPGKGRPGVPAKYVRPNGNVTLYRYSRQDRGDTYEIDPEKTQPQSYSRRDYEAAGTKRTFFYLDPEHKEAIIGNQLYGAEVSADRIYNLKEDPDQLLKKHRWGVRADIDKILRVLKEEGWAGVHYSTAGMDLVNLFEKTTGQSIEQPGDYAPPSEQPAVATAPQMKEATRISTPQLVASLFQKAGGRVVGSMEQILKNGKIQMMIRAFKGSDIDTGLEEMAHAIRRLVVTRDLTAKQRGFSDDLLTAIEKRFGVVNGEWTVAAEEAFAREYRQRFAQGAKGLKVASTKLGKAYDRLSTYLTNFYSNIKRGLFGDQEVSKEMDLLFATLIERRARIARVSSEEQKVVAQAHLNVDGLIGSLKGGGFTFDLSTGKHAETGYAVAPSKASEFIFRDDVPDAEARGKILEFVVANSKELAKPGVNLGAWRDDGYYWIDSSIVVLDKDEASRIGRENDQEAIWDIANGEEIRLKGKEDAKAYDDAKDQTQAKATIGTTKEGPRIRSGEGQVQPTAPGPAVQGVGPTSLAQETGRGQAEGRGQEEEGARGPDPGVQAQNLSDYETPETLQARQKAADAGRIDWSPNTGPKGAREGKAKPPTEVVRDILALVGITAVDYDPKSRPGVLGYYSFSTTMAKKIFGRTGRELWLSAKSLAEIGTAVHEVAHFLDDKYNISGFQRRLTQVGGIEPEGAPGILEGADPAVQMQFQLLDYFVAQKGGLRQDKTRGMAEGFAEAVRLYCEAPDPSAVLGQDVKSFLDALILQHPEVRSLMGQTRSQTQAYLNLPVAQRVSLALTSPDARNADPGESYYARQDRTGKSRGWWRTFVLKVQNKMRDLEQMENRIKNIFGEMWEKSGEDVNEAWDRFLRTVGGLPSQLHMLAQSRITWHTDHAVRFGVLDPMTFEKIGGSAASIFQNFKNKKMIEDFGRYMYAKVALLRWQQAQEAGTDYIISQNLRPEELREIVKQTEEGENAQLFDDTMNAVTNYFNTLLNLEVAHGLKSAGEAAAMIATHEIYMPFFRDMSSDVAQTSRGTGGKLIGVTSSIRKMKGGHVLPVLNVYDALVDRTADVMSEVVRKASESNFLKFVEVSGVSGDFVRKLTKEEAEGVDGVTTIERNGTKYYYKIDPDLKDALTQLGPQLSPVMASILGWVGAPTDWAKKFLVTYNVPFFMPKNYMRDLKTTALRGLQDLTGIEGADTTYLTARAAKRGTEDMMRAVTGNTKTASDVDKLYKLLGLERQTRVKTSRSKSRSKGQVRRTFLGKKDRTGLEAAADWAVNTAEYLENVNDAVELGPRREAFLMTLQLLGQTEGSGFSVDENGKVTGEVPQWALTRAGSNALEVTTNFNRRGQWQPYLEPLFMFFNAAVQGTAGMGMTASKAIEDIKTGGGKGHARRFAIMAAMAATAKIAQYSMMAAMPAGDDDEDLSMLDLWAERADYIRGTSDVWMFSPRFGISIPREREWGFFHRAVDQAVAHAVRDGANPWAVHLFAKELLKPANLWKETVEEVDQRLPLSGGLLPMTAQLFFNYDMFRSKEIESKWEEGKLPKYRYDERTGTPARWLGAASQAVANTVGVPDLAIGPQKWDFIINQQLGSAPGKLIEDVMAIAAPEKMRRNNIPFVGPFLTDPIARQSISDYYELRERSGMELDEWKNDRRDLPEKTVARILDNEATIGVADSILKLIREYPDDKLTREQKSMYQTGIARWALERKPLETHPNLLLQYLSDDIPNDLKMAAFKVLKKEITKKPTVEDIDKQKPERIKAKYAARARIRPRLKPQKKD